mgnify:CR=1 FL=1
MNMLFANKLCIVLFFCITIGECWGDDEQVSKSSLSHDDFVWQYHYTTPSENMSPATGLVLRAINKASGKTLLRMSIGQDSDRPAMLFTIHSFDPSGRMFSSFYVTDSRGQDYLKCKVEEKGHVLSSIGYYRNSSLDMDSSNKLDKINKRRQDMQLKTGEEALSSFPWKDLDGSVVDQMGSYVEPAPKVVETRDLDSSEEPIEPSNDELEKITGPNAICFYTRVDFENMARIFSIPKTELDNIPSWKVGEKPPLSCENAIAKVLDSLSALNGTTNTTYEVASVSLEQLSRKYKDKWYYMAEVRMKNTEGNSDLLDICVLMNGVILEPKKVDAKLIENISASSIGRGSIGVKRTSVRESRLR